MHYGKSLISAPRLTDHHRRMHGDHGEIPTPNQTDAPLVRLIYDLLNNANANSKEVMIVEN